jgi:hypothetical protein
LIISAKPDPASGGASVGMAVDGLTNDLRPRFFVERRFEIARITRSVSLIANPFSKTIPVTAVSRHHRQVCNYFFKKQELDSKPTQNALSLEQQLH